MRGGVLVYLYFTVIGGLLFPKRSRAFFNSSNVRYLHGSKRNGSTFAGNELHDLGLKPILVCISFFKINLNSRESKRVGRGSKTLGFGASSRVLAIKIKQTSFFFFLRKNLVL